MQLQIEIEREDDGRWLADIPALPGVMAYGATRAEAIEHGERSPEVADAIFAIAA